MPLVSVSFDDAPRDCSLSSFFSVLSLVFSSAALKVKEFWGSSSGLEALPLLPKRPAGWGGTESESFVAGTFASAGLVVPGGAEKPGQPGPAAGLCVCVCVCVCDSTYVHASSSSAKMLTLKLTAQCISPVYLLTPWQP